MSERKDYTIGLLLGQMEESYVAEIWPGIRKYTEDAGLNLVLFDARFPASDNGYDFKHNVINNFISESTIDGLIIIAGEMGDYLSNQEIQDYCRQFLPLPMVSISYKIPGLHNVLVDNYGGMYEAVDHLIKHHGKCRIVYINGPEDNPEAEQRLEGYKAALADNGIPVDEELIFPGNFTQVAGQDAAADLLRSGVSYDAIAAADDIMALGAMGVLKAVGVNIPQDVAIVGFDNTAQGSMTTPPLTSVDQPLFRTGYKSAQVLHKMLNGEETEETTTMDTSLNVRQSCGCPPGLPFQIKPEILNVQEHQVVDSDIDEDELADALHEAFTRLENDLCHDPRISKTVARGFLEDYRNRMEGTALLSALNSVCGTSFSTGIDPAGCKLLLSETVRVTQTFDQFDPLLLRPMFYQIELFLNGLLIREQSLLKMEEESKVWNLYLAVESLGVSFDPNDHKERVENILPLFGIRTCLVVLYKNAVGSISVRDWQLPEESRLFMCYHDHRRREDLEDQGTFLSRQVIPPGPWQEESGQSLLLMPLFFDKEQFGYILFSFGKVGALFYEVLRVQISNVLKGALLMNEREQAEEDLRDALSKLETINVQLHTLSQNDELTGLYNRRGFMGAGKQMMKDSRKTDTPFLLFFADLDGLKVINDTWGHEEGDKAIKGAATVLRKVFRDHDIIARLAGDEFTVLAWNAQPRDAEMIISRIDAAVKDFNEGVDWPYELSISLGYTPFNSTRKVSFDTLLAEADKMLYENKQARKKRTAEK